MLVICSYGDEHLANGDPEDVEHRAPAEETAQRVTAKGCSHRGSHDRANITRNAQRWLCRAAAMQACPTSDDLQLALRDVLGGCARCGPTAIAPPAGYEYWQRVARPVLERRASSIIEDLNDQVLRARAAGEPYLAAQCKEATALAERRARDPINQRPRSSPAPSNARFCRQLG